MTEAINKCFLKREGINSILYIIENAYKVLAKVPSIQY